MNVLCAVLEVLGDQERDFQGLRVVQTRVAQGLVAVSQCCLVDSVGAAQAFGHVVAGHLHVDTAGARR